MQQAALCVSPRTLERNGSFRKHRCHWRLPTLCLAAQRLLLFTPCSHRTRFVFSVRKARHFPVRFSSRSSAPSQTLQGLFHFRNGAGLARKFRRWVSCQRAMPNLVKGWGVVLRQVRCQFVRLLAVLAPMGKNQMQTEVRFPPPRMRSNPSVELTNCSKLQSAAHLER